MNINFSVFVASTLTTGCGLWMFLLAAGELTREDESETARASNFALLAILLSNMMTFVPLEKAAWHGLVTLLDVFGMLIPVIVHQQPHTKATVLATLGGFYVFAQCTIMTHTVLHMFGVAAMIWNCAVFAASRVIVEYMATPEMMTGDSFLYTSTLMASISLVLHASCMQIVMKRRKM